jgi:hypothetical protein
LAWKPTTSFRPGWRAACRVKEAAFEIADLHAQRRLGDVEPGGGASEVQLFSNSDEVAQNPQLEGRLHGSTVATAPMADQ